MPINIRRSKFNFKIKKMEDYNNNKKEFNYKLIGWSFIGIIVLLFILSLTKSSNIVKVNKKDVIDSTWVEFPNTITKTTPRYLNKTESGFVFTTNYKKYQKGDTIILKN